MMLDESVLIPVSSSDGMLAATPALQGLKRMRTNQMTLYDAWLA